MREQKRLIDQRKENVKDMLMNVPRNNPYKNINPDEGLNMPKPEINREKSQNINEQLKKLRERVGN